MKQYLGNNILLIENILCMLKCLSAGKYIRITMYGGITMKGWKYDARIKVRPMQRWSGGGRIVVQKWREGGVSANTFYFTILFRICCASAL